MFSRVMTVRIPQHWFMGLTTFSITQSDSNQPCAYKWESQVLNFSSKTKQKQKLPNYTLNHTELLWTHVELTEAWQLFLGFLSALSSSSQHTLSDRQVQVKPTPTLSEAAERRDLEAPTAEQRLQSLSPEPLSFRALAPTFSELTQPRSGNMAAPLCCHLTLPQVGSEPLVLGIPLRDP